MLVKTNPLRALIISDELNALSNVASVGIGLQQVSLSQQALKISKDIAESVEIKEEIEILKEILQLQKDILQELKNIKNS